ncbi:MAG: pseudoazurin [Candidatus Pelagibacterales bacterium]|jgi:pseudoazurin
MRKITHYIIAFTIFFMFPALAETFEVQMLNKFEKERNLFNPSIIYVNSGDTVKWIATDKGHNVAFTKTGVPDGVELYKSKLNTDAEYIFNTPGIYAYNCTPHYGLGMIAFVVVDNDLSNYEQVAKIKYPGKSKKLAKVLLEQIKNDN